MNNFNTKFLFNGEKWFSIMLIMVYIGNCCWGNKGPHERDITVEF